jgi:hypothetical protein
MFISEEERKRAERGRGGDSGEKSFPRTREREKEKSYLFFERPQSLGF